jgi:hypothetical protein
MRRDIENHVHGCHYCKCRKAENRVPLAPVQRFEPIDRPFGQVHADLTGPFNETEDGNNYIVVRRCRLTKYIIIKAIRGKTEQTVRKALTEEFERYRYPLKLVTDRGKEFSIDKLKALLRNNRPDAQLKTITPQAPRVMKFIWEEVATRLSTINVDRFNKPPTKRLEFKPYSIGDFIFIKRIPRRLYKNKQDKKQYILSRKLQHSYCGPFRIIEKLSDVAYIVDMYGKAKTSHIINVKHA